MKKEFCFVAMLLASFAFAQISPIQEVANSTPAFSATLVNGKVIDAKAENNATVGSPYWSEDFQPAKITNVDMAMAVRYNIAKDELEFLKDDKVFIVPKIAEYRMIEFVPDSKRLLLYNNSYYVVVKEVGENLLLKKLRMNYTPAREAKNGYETQKPAVYARKKDEYFILDKDGQFAEFDKSSAFTSMKEESKSFKVDWKNEKSVTESFQLLYK